MSNSNNIKPTVLYAILATVVLHVLAFLYVNLSTLSTQPPVIEDLAILELDYRTPEEIEELLNPEEPEIDQTNQSIKDLMQDIQDIRNKSLNNFSESQIAQEVEQEVLNRNKENSTQEEGELESNNLTSENNTRNNNTQPKTVEKENQYAGKVTRFCNVPGRECYTVAPSYTCKGGGKVYIEIKVDKIGRVKSATVNPSKSTTTGECIINQALDYAKRTTKVSSDLKGEHSNKGYIIYNFVSQ